MNSLLEVIRNNGDTHTRLLELLVSRAFEGGPIDQSLQLPFKSSLLQAKTGSTRFKAIDLEKIRGLSSRTNGSNKKVETTSVDMIEVQRMIDSALKMGPKFPKFIHPYPAYVEKFEYPKGFKILNFSLFARESSLSSLKHVALFTAQCRDMNSASINCHNSISH
ncbi:hypothetical protein ACFX15_014060 [Malus domestica]